MKNTPYNRKDKLAIILQCSGIGDCLFASSVIKKIYQINNNKFLFDIFTCHPKLFKTCPYINKPYDIKDKTKLQLYEKQIVLFDTSKYKHWLMDTFDFISLPIGIGQLSFREKQLEYFPIEKDKSEIFDVVINTSITWPSRSWPIESWQKLADVILKLGYSVAVVGKDIWSETDKILKKSAGLEGCTDLTNKLSLDQTYYTIKNSKLFITCQNGLSVLSGATDVEIIVLDMSIEWSKRAIYRNEDPHYKVTYVKGNCPLYCCQSFKCPLNNSDKHFKCIPDVEKVMDVVIKKLSCIRAH